MRQDQRHWEPHSALGDYVTTTKSAHKLAGELPDELEGEVQDELADEVPDELADELAYELADETLLQAIHQAK